MAIAVFTRQIYGRTLVSATLLDGVEASGDGEWVDVRGVWPLTLDIRGISGDTVEVRYANGPEIPANNIHALQAGDDITSDTGVSFEMPVDWLKVMVSAYSAGTINAYLSGVLS